MKQINSILRTLCLTALLCMTSVSASAYKFYDDNSFSSYGIYGEDIVPFLGNDRILVIDKNITIGNFSTPFSKEYAIIIIPGVTVTVTENFLNYSKIYVFGTLKFKDSMGDKPNNYGIIYIVTEGTIISEGEDIKNRGEGTIETVSLETILTKAKLSGQAPTPTANGWKDYWAKGIESTAHDDFYPMYYYSDEACTKVISNLEEWKKNEGKIDKLGPFTIGSTTGDVDEGYCYHGDITFTDKDFYSSDYDFTVDGTLTYTRDVSPVIGKWQAWFVPFDLTLTSDDLAKFDAAQVAGVLTDNDGQPVIAFKKMKNGEKMKANIPYVIRPKSEIVQEISWHLLNPEFHSSVTTPFVIQSAYDNFTLGGIYEAQQNSNWYALTKDGVFKKMNGTPAPTLQPQRIWMTVTPREDDPYATKSVSTTRSIGTKSTAIPDVIRIVVLGDDGSPEGKPVREAKIINADGQSVNRIQRGQVYRISGNVNE